MTVHADPVSVNSVRAHASGVQMDSAGIGNVAELGQPASSGQDGTMTHCFRTQAFARSSVSASRARSRRDSIEVSDGAADGARADGPDVEADIEKIVALHAARVPGCARTVDASDACDARPARVMPHEGCNESTRDVKVGKSRQAPSSRRSRSASRQTYRA